MAMAVMAAVLSDTADAMITACRQAARQRELDVEPETDFRAWARELRRSPGITAVSQAFDPDFCDLEQAVWLRLHDGRRLLGTIAGKRIEGDIRALQREGALWFGRRTAEFSSLALEFPPEVPEIRGTLAYFGALWLHPDVRGAGLAGPMARMMRAVGMREWMPEWLCGGVLEPLALRGVPTRIYGYAHCVRISREIHFPVTGAPAVLYMPWESRSEWLDSSRRYLRDREQDLSAAASRAG